MSELDLDIRGVSSASLGARSTASDANQIAQAPAVDQSSNASANQSVQPIAGASSGQPSFRYDSFRFVYTPSYGRIVLIDQNPETGKAISQIPSQRALQLYADQKRAELQTELTPKAESNVQAAQGAIDGSHHEFLVAAAGQGAGLANGGRVGAQSSASSPATTSSSTPTPFPAYLLQSASPVNITI